MATLGVIAIVGGMMTHFWGTERADSARTRLDRSERKAAEAYKNWQTRHSLMSDAKMMRGTLNDGIRHRALASSLPTLSEELEATAQKTSRIFEMDVESIRLNMRLAEAINKGWPNREGDDDELSKMKEALEELKLNPPVEREEYMLKTELASQAISDVRTERLAFDRVISQAWWMKFGGILFGSTGLCLIVCFLPRWMKESAKSSGKAVES
ncbi:hypothetical protein [Novipirellula rosea]|uniref:hypothetical protein n=1 Tax=Novipirellula rosea TaxID=1031540 RepID=UPI0031E7845E